MPNIGTLPAHYRPIIAHLVTIFVSLSDSSETHLSTGRVRQTFASNEKRRAVWDNSGEHGASGLSVRFLQAPGPTGGPYDGQDGERYGGCRAERPARGPL